MLFMILAARSTVRIFHALTGIRTADAFVAFALLSNQIPDYKEEDESKCNHCYNGCDIHVAASFMVLILTQTVPFQKLLL